MHSSKKVFETKKKIKKTETCFLLSWSLKAWDYTIFMSTSLHAACRYERYARHFCPLAFSSAVVSWVVDIYLNTNNQKNPMKHCSCSKIYLQIFLGSWNKYPLKIIIKSTKIKYLKYRAKLKNKNSRKYIWERGTETTASKDNYVYPVEQNPLDSALHLLRFFNFPQQFVIITQTLKGVKNNFSKKGCIAREAARFFIKMTFWFLLKLK